MFADPSRGFAPTPSDQHTSVGTICCHEKCPLEFTKNMSTKIHPKRGNRQKCPREFTLRKCPLEFAHFEKKVSFQDQLLRFQVEAHGKFTRKWQKEKITKRVWFYQGWALQMGAGLEKNIQWSQSVQIWGCQKPLRLWKWDWRTRNQEIKDQSFSAVVVLIHKAKGCVRRQRPVSKLLPKGAKKTTCGP